jgi:hypothetical protein
MISKKKILVLEHKDDKIKLKYFLKNIEQLFGKKVRK